MRLAIEGIPGVGKSTLCQGLAKVLRARCLDEPVQENPYLEDYYKAPDQWALAMQVDLLMQRVSAAATEGRVLFDRSLWGDQVFARVAHRLGALETREFHTYQRVWEKVAPPLLPPQAVYLQVSTDTAWKRIQLRGRHSEQALQYSYLDVVREEYDAYFLNPPKGLSVQVVDWTTFQTAEEMAPWIQQACNLS